MLDAFLALWEAAVELGHSLSSSPRGAQSYVTPREMSVSDIATDIYGSSERASEILVNNDFSDPFAVSAGTKIIYFAGIPAAA